MEVLAITIFLSLSLAGFFVVLFVSSQRGVRHSLEQEALLPLDEGGEEPNRHPKSPERRA